MTGEQDSIEQTGNGAPGRSRPAVAAVTVAVLAALSLVAAACGGGDSDEAPAFGATETADADAGGDTSDTSDGAADVDNDDDTATDEVAAEGLAAGDESIEAEAAVEGDGDSASDATEGSSRSQAAPTTTTAADDGGGFFGVEPEEELTEDDLTDAEAEDNTFRDYGVRPFVATEVDPLSTFALDVDTASYSVGRRWLEDGAVPPAESVRVEEYLNSFDYDYLTPSEGLGVQVDGGPSPYDPDRVMIRVGVQAERVANDARPNAALTFVVDTSGSMDRSNRLGLVKTSLRRLVEELGPSDSVAIVTYSDFADVVLPPTSVADESIILAAIDALQPTGSTNLEAGLTTGYELAAEAFQPGQINRVVLASDGVANVGLTDPDGLARMIRDDADRGVQLVTVGVGMGNFNDVVMEQLADRGDGFYAYVDDENEAERLFSDDLVSTLLTVAIDGKIQVEFNPDAVSDYRLLGFENRAVLDQDFRNDEVDAGELGAGHQVTALYELALRDGRDDDDQLGTVQLRWEDPDEGTVRESRLVIDPSAIDESWSQTDPDFRLAVTVAAFAELLRDSPHTGDTTLDQVADEVRDLSPGSGAVEELLTLVERAERLS
jgi:Ca-activated chloride channel family protein